MKENQNAATPSDSNTQVGAISRRRWLEISSGMVAANALSAWSPCSSMSAQTSRKAATGGALLWDKEPALWDAAKKHQITRPLFPEFGWEGPRGGRGNIPVNGPNFMGPGKNGVNLSNERLESSLWGTPDRLVLSLGKSDVWNRAQLSVKTGKKPVGQIQLLAEDFAGAELPAVSTSIHNGNNTLRMQKGSAAVDLEVMLTDGETNVIAIKADYTGLTKPVALRLSRHLDSQKSMPAPQSGNDGTYFWIHQKFPKEKTFPDGFDYSLVAKIVGAKVTMETADMQLDLGAPVPPSLRDPAAPGSAATAEFPPAAKQSVVIYVTVVTRAEAEDTLAEAKKRLAAAEKQGYSGLLEKNAAWYRTLFADREQGRIFTSNFDDAKDVILPFIYQSRRHSRHTYIGNPDPERYEGEANYNILETDTALWYGLQCFNEELYTGDFVVGRDETVADYYVKLFNFWRPAWEKNAAKKGYNGLLVLRGYIPPILPDEPVSPCAYTYANGVDWASLVWAFKNVWDAWDYGGHDITFLRDKVYPSLRGVADFFASLVKMGDDGYYHIDPSQIREETVGRDAIDCIASAKWSFNRAMEAAALLDVDADKCAVWKERLDKMMPYYIIDDGKNPPHFASLVLGGQPRVSGHGTSHFLVNVADEVNLESPVELRQMLLHTNQSRAYGEPMNRQVEHLLGHMPDTIVGSGNYQWIHLFGHPAWMMFYAQKNGGGEYARTTQLKTQQQKTIACWLEPERLCNSRSGSIFLFPCAPSDFDVAFKDFQARGGFLVSAERKNGEVSFARIKARRDGPCKVMNPWPGKKLQVLEMPSKRKIDAAPTGEIYLFTAKSGKEYTLIESNI